MTSSLDVGARAEAPGRVHCEVRDNGRPAPGELALDGGPWQACDRGLAVSDGEHPVRVRLRGALTGAETRQWVSVEAGATHLVRASFETGELLLWGPPEPGSAAAATAEVWHDGKTYGVLQGVAARLGIGSYVVDARAGERTERFAAVHINPGGRTVLVWRTER